MAPAAQERQQRNTRWHYFHIMDKNWLRIKEVSLIENQEILFFIFYFFYRIGFLTLEMWFLFQTFWWNSPKIPVADRWTVERLSSYLSVCLFVFSICDWPALGRTSCRLQPKFMAHSGSVLTAPQKHTQDKVCSHTRATTHPIIITCNSICYVITELSDILKSHISTLLQ